MSVRILNGDCRDVLRTLPEQSVQTCVTSPPYFGLRDYGHAGQIGLEQTPDEFVAELVAVFREVKRVLADDGTLWVNMGDSYAGSGKGWNADGSHQEGGKQGTNKGTILGSLVKTKAADCKPKDLIGVPWLLAFALRADGWYLRQDIIWHKPNQMPESVRDRCTKAHEYIFLLSKSERYFFDGEAIKEQAAQPDRVCTNRFGGNKYVKGVKHSDGSTYTGSETRNRRSVWTVATQPFSGAHFATYPPNLIEPCILAGSRPGDTVLDPFFGAGTTGLVADRLGRNCIGVELNPEYAALAEDRIRGDLALFADVTQQAAE